MGLTKNPVVPAFNAVGPALRTMELGAWDWKPAWYPNATANAPWFKFPALKPMAMAEGLWLVCADATPTAMLLTLVGKMPIAP